MTRCVKTYLWYHCMVIIDTALSDVVLIVISKQLKTEESSPLLPLTTDWRHCRVSWRIEESSLEKVCWHVKSNCFYQTECTKTYQSWQKVTRSDCPMLSPQIEQWNRWVSWSMNRLRYHFLWLSLICNELDTKGRAYQQHLGGQSSYTCGSFRSGHQGICGDWWSWTHPNSLKASWVLHVWQLRWCVHA